MLNVKKRKQKLAGKKHISNLTKSITKFCTRLNYRTFLKTKNNKISRDYVSNIVIKFSRLGFVSLRENLTASVVRPEILLFFNITRLSYFRKHRSSIFSCNNLRLDKKYSQHSFYLVFVFHSLIFLNFTGYSLKLREFIAKIERKP